MSRRKGPKALAGLGHRWALWDFDAGFTILRSASRAGVSDLGVNAARIQAFIDRWVEGSLVR